MAHYQQRKGGKGHGDNLEEPLVSVEALEQIMNELWASDDNKCYHGQDFEVCLQGRASTRTERDASRHSLFNFFDKDKIFSMETYSAFKDLLNNYTLECGEAEKVTPEEVKENRQFIEAVMKTDVMQKARAWLISKDVLPDHYFTPDSVLEEKGIALDFNFMKMLYKLWFSLYRRTRGDRDLDSSSFEHVFVGEAKQGKIVGLHNWLQFYLEEQAGRIDYHGYFGFKTDCSDESFRLLTLQFEMVGDEDEDEDVGGIKKMSSIFLGTSPEFELAAYTILYLTKMFGKHEIKIGEYEVMTECFPFGNFGIGTAYIGCR
ncbi:poly(U)-specific endoribonuclease-B-like [Mizuhopecten yessoensis]|uniref:Uridylate-specific endoribonuclease n=1 Tax=Mizuhopecten yessoensis TaxID=6573 RepID=A0A210QF68_MIZYE|nr:poly(U)-specific endoribonuclease-B-like [Mizuhopecten yessoensis]OWF47271.1 Poly(U)-specific endoribonuclease [Mizuhopecten yessoensis]